MIEKDGIKRIIVVVPKNINPHYKGLLNNALDEIKKRYYDSFWGYEVIMRTIYKNLTVKTERKRIISKTAPKKSRSLRSKKKLEAKKRRGTKKR